MILGYSITLVFLEKLITHLLFYLSADLHVRSVVLR